jgi:hypothetical protein
MKMFNWFFNAGLYAKFPVANPSPIQPEFIIQLKAE